MIAFFSNIFGYIVNFIYQFVQNYGVSIIIFSFLLKLVQLPLSISQQKSMKKNAKIQEKTKEIQEKYKNNQEKMNSEIMDLYKKEKINPFGGCLSSIIQIILLFAMFYLVRSPLTYMKKIDNKEIDNIKSYIQQEAGENAIGKTYPEISIIKYIAKLHNNESIKENIEIEDKAEDIEETEVENKEEIEEINLDKEIIEKAYINMDFLGLDLSNVPFENKTNLAVFIIPVLYVISSIASMKLTTMMGQGNKKKEEIVESPIEDDEKKDEEKEGDMTTEMTAQMGKSMSWFIPIMSVSISLVAPLGLALYWLINNILMIGERLILNKILDSKEEKENV